jgi:hypothetical protein
MPRIPCFGAHCLRLSGQWIRVYGNAAVNTAYYTFSYRKNGEARELPARYSFTFVKAGDEWVIVDHHSSAMPAAPK